MTSDDAEDIVERLLGRPYRLRRHEVSRLAGVPFAQTQRFWRALGFAPTGDDEIVFTESDLGALRKITSMIGPEFDEELALAITRAVAGTCERLAAWQTSLVMESLVRSGQVVTDDPEEGEEDDGAPDLRGDPDAIGDLAAALTAESEADEKLWGRRLGPEALEHVGQVILRLADDLEPLIVFAWRRHLAASVGQLMAERSADLGDAASIRSIGFADMVGYTSLVRRLSERQLAALVGDFQRKASGIVAAHGGRLVKTLGDGVVYLTEQPAQAAAIALDLVDAVGGDQHFPQLRIGIATGDVLRYIGDVFGTTVNRASRLADVAGTQTVVLDDATATGLSAVSGFAMTRLPARPLRGLGRTGMWRLARTSGPADRGPHGPGGPGARIGHIPAEIVGIEPASRYLCRPTGAPAALAGPLPPTSPDTPPKTPPQEMDER